jgi:hypothetical protein
MTVQAQEEAARHSPGCFPDLITQLDRARDRIDQHSALLQWSFDLREWLRWGILDLDDAMAEVYASRRACRDMVRP